jgi:hypothetical protein
MIRLSVSSRHQPEVTPVVPFKNKIQYYQLKQSFLITYILEVCITFTVATPVKGIAYVIRMHVPTCSSKN